MQGTYLVEFSYTISLTFAISVRVHTIYISTLVLQSAIYEIVTRLLHKHCFDRWLYSFHIRYGLAQRNAYMIYISTTGSQFAWRICDANTRWQVIFIFRGKIHQTCEFYWYEYAKTNKVFIPCYHNERMIACEESPISMNRYHRSPDVPFTIINNFNPSMDK